jgi:HK97 gp10 family phage protein
MRVENWHAKEIFSQIADEALKAGNEIMDDVVAASRAECPVGTITREGKWISATVAFTPVTRNGKNIPTHKQKAVSFQAKQWTGRYPGQLRDTIRRVNKSSRPGNIRVYAGNAKVNYARFVEYGTRKTPMHSFMRTGFNGIRNSVIRRIEEGIAKVPEVKK